MFLFRKFAIGLRSLFRKNQVDRELDEELGAYLEMEAAEKMKQGVSRKDALREVRLERGTLEITKEIVRSAGWESFVEACWQDLRFAGRMLGKNLGFTSVTVLVMALGIGANAAMFSVVNDVLLRPLSFNDPDRIVTLSSLWKQDGSHGPVSAPDFRDWHDQSNAFDAMAYYEDDDTAVTASAVAEYAHVAMVSPEFFQVFRIQPIAGREFSPEETKPGSAGAVVIGNSCALNHFGSAVNAVGHKIGFAGRTLEIVGVLPPRFHFPGKSDVWFPSNTLFPDTESRSGHNYSVVARLKPTVTLEQARAQMTAIGSRLEQKYPDSNTGKNVAVTRMRDDMVSNFRFTLWVMLAAVGVVLLIACANVANMLLAKAVGRNREIAVRAALGASRARIIRQLSTESLLMALLAGALGVLLALWGARVLVTLAPADVPRLAEARIDTRVLAFTFIVSVVASLLFGLAPALQVLRVDLDKSLKQGTTRSTGGGLADRLRRTLVVAEIALSMMLLTAAGLLLKSFVALQNVSLGFRPERVLVVESNVLASDLEGQKRATRFYKDLLSQVVNIPGVLHAGATRTLPGHAHSAGSYWVDYLPQHPDFSKTPNAVFSIVAPGTFSTLGIPLLEGRDFNDSDTYKAPFSAIINEKLAKDTFHGQDPIGHVIYWGLDTPDPMRIVGVVGDVRQWGPARSPWPEIFGAYQQHPAPSTNLNVVVRTAIAPGALSETLRQKARGLSADVPVKFTTMEASLSENVAAPRFRTLLLGVFATLAVCLAMAGVYGVMSYVVGQRSNEIGLRMALGANPGDVSRLVLRQALVLASLGIVIGLACSAAVTRLLQSMLFEVKPSDPLTYVVVIAALAAVALAASYVPARRAMRVDPMVALRYE